MDSVNNKNYNPQKFTQPSPVSNDIEIDVGLGSVQIGSLGCDGCSVLLYSLIDQTIATFNYNDGKLTTVHTFDLQLNPGYLFELKHQKDKYDVPYYAIVVHIHGVGIESLINIKDFEQAKQAYAEIDMLTRRFRQLH